MEVYIDPSDGRFFPVEIDFFETVREIKQRIEIYTGIPVTDQTLLFNGEVLDDDGMARHLGIKEGSYIRLKVGDPESVSRKLRLRIKTPLSSAPLFMEVDRDDTVRSLKERIQERETSVPADRIVLQVLNTVLLDDLSVYESGLIDDAQIDMFIKPALLGTPQGSRPGSTRAGASGRLTVQVLPWDREQRILIEVNKSSKAEVLRGELEKLQVTEGFELPSEYFFIHEQNAMEDDKTFQWHGVKQGDNIDVFRGKIIG